MKVLPFQNRQEKMPALQIPHVPGKIYVKAIWKHICAKVCTQLLSAYLGIYWAAYWEYAVTSYLFLQHTDQEGENSHNISAGYLKSMEIPEGKYGGQKMCFPTTDTWAYCQVDDTT